MKIVLIGCLTVACAVSVMSTLTAEEQLKESVMEGFPPTKASQATMSNYLETPYSQWAFANAGAPLNVVMIPRQGTIFELTGPTMPNLGNLLCLMPPEKPWDLKTYLLRIMLTA